MLQKGARHSKMTLQNSFGQVGRLSTIQFFKLINFLEFTQFLHCLRAVIKCICPKQEKSLIVTPLSTSSSQSLSWSYRIIIITIIIIIIIIIIRIILVFSDIQGDLACPLLQMAKRSLTVVAIHTSPHSLSIAIYHTLFQGYSHLTKPNKICWIFSLISCIVYWLYLRIGCMFVLHLREFVMLIPKILETSGWWPFEVTSGKSEV